MNPSIFIADQLNSSTLFSKYQCMASSIVISGTSQSISVCAAISGWRLKDEFPVFTTTGAVRMHDHFINPVRQFTLARPEVNQMRSFADDIQVTA